MQKNKIWPVQMIRRILRSDAPYLLQVWLTRHRTEIVKFSGLSPGQHLSLFQSLQVRLTFSSSFCSINPHMSVCDPFRSCRWNKNFFNHLRQLVHYNRQFSNHIVFFFQQQFMMFLITFVCELIYNLIDCKFNPWYSEPAWENINHNSWNTKQIGFAVKIF